MNKQTAVSILAMAISLVACKSGEGTNVVPTHAIEVRDTEGQLLLTVDGIHGLKRPKNAGQVVITLWEADGTKYESAWTMPPFPVGTNKLSEGFIPRFTIETNIMSKDLLMIQPSIATNWQSIGTYTPKTGSSEDVQRGNIVTNTTAILEWKGKRHELLLESVNGPDCGERRVPKPNQWPQYWQCITNAPWIGALTNLYIDHIEATNLGQWFIQGQTNIGIQN